MSTEADGVGRRLIFRQLFPEDGRVEIPILQRDYAQGRAAESEVRRDFLEALSGALTGGTPLDLDFVYGSVVKLPAAGLTPARQALQPLDGQQRLTTLFLLHWYLAWREEEGAHFTGFMRDAAHPNPSRFSYAVRPSSTEFFDELVGYRPDRAPMPTEKLSDLLCNESWFFRSWQLDPTIQAALGMLDAIHARFDPYLGAARPDGTPKLYHRLVQEQPPIIAFQMLPLGEFRLSDDLYIKMNARGKPLTPFETFKARLEPVIKELFGSETKPFGDTDVTVQHYFSHRMDVEWAQTFWPYRDAAGSSAKPEKKKDGANLIDAKVMQLVRAMAIVTRHPEASTAEATVDALREPKETLAFAQYQRLGCLDRELIETFIEALDFWSGHAGDIRTILQDGAVFDERSMFTRAIDETSRLTFEELVQFHAWCAYLRQHAGRDPVPDAFAEWMRIIRNLAVNTDYDRTSVFLRCLRSVQELLAQSDALLEHFATSDFKLEGFSGQQVREEQLKALLVRRSSAWRELILAAESHPYFEGQIEFLLDFCGVYARWEQDGAGNWTTEEDGEFRARFTTYLEKAGAVFRAEGLRPIEAFKWERALLAIDDYLPHRAGDNYSLGTNARDQPTSWKRLLRGNARGEGPERREIVRQLLDELDLTLGLEPALEAALGKERGLLGWRRVLVQRPALMGYCQQRCLRFYTPEHIYLLSGVRRSGRHVELFTYHLFVDLLQPACANRQLEPFEQAGYQEQSTDAVEPYAYLSAPSCRLEIHRGEGSFRLCLAPAAGAFPASLQEALLAEGYLDEAGAFRITVARPATPAALGRLRVLLSAEVDA